MDRLIYKEADGTLAFRFSEAGKVLPTLYAYEETGLTPEEVMKLKAQSDAAIADLERAEEKANDMGGFLDNVIHPNCDYSIYTEAHDLLSDIVHWEHDDVWQERRNTNG